MAKKGVIVPVILILFAAISWWIAAAKMRTLARAREMTQVLVAREDLDAGTALREGLLEVMPIPRLYMQQDAYEMRSMADMKLVSGVVTAARIPKGNQITLSCLVSASPTAEGGVKLPPGQQHYIDGLKHFQNGDYKKAREEWTAAKKADPSNIEVKAGLKRIEDILAVRR